MGGACKGCLSFLVAGRGSVYMSYRSDVKGEIITITCIIIPLTRVDQIYHGMHSLHHSRALRIAFQDVIKLIQRGRSPLKPGGF